MTKGMKRQIRKHSRSIKRELDFHKGSESEYCKVSYFDHDAKKRDYFVVHRCDLDEAMKGI